ncbi:Cysteine-rich venom protein [Merluccius polli]|uniref:Cysteine-rich venom protein n=1 Tax=Merluccius polli TaxID=89951 RepID=A0AA47NYS2_MERPO|nr:Cysteine-rich venom protein [Merluccius polli]
MAMYTFAFLCTWGLLALQVPNTFADPLPVTLTSTDHAEIVNKHNALRGEVKPTPSNMLEMRCCSQRSTRGQHLLHTCSMNYSPDNSRMISTSGCGENHYMSSEKNPWSNAIRSWNNKVEDWNSNSTCVVQVQLIGCAMADCPKSEYNYFYVCHYCPPGNSQYTNPYKSGTSCGDCPNACNNKLCSCPHVTLTLSIHLSLTANPCAYANKYSNCPDLKQKQGCDNKDVASWCEASCKCITEII